MSQLSEKSVEDKLMRGFQRDFPLVRQPFAEIAARTGTTERDVIAACEGLKQAGVIARVGGVVRPNTIAASTLAAVAISPLSTDSVGEVMSAIDGLNHVYLREHPLNFWFVATGPDRAFVDGTLAKVEQLTGQPVLDLRLERSFHIDLGFPLDGEPPSHAPPPELPIRYHKDTLDNALVQALTTGVPIISRPFREIGDSLKISEVAVIARLKHLVRAGVVTRIGVIVRHRALGWRSNAMVVWDVAPDLLEGKARLLAAQPGVNLCYQRRRHDDRWPYNLYCMIHAKSREMALALLKNATDHAGLAGERREVLFSSRCYKQTGALIVDPKVAA